MFILSALTVNTVWAQTVVVAQLQGEPTINTTGWTRTGSAAIGDTPGDPDGNSNELILTQAYTLSGGAIFLNEKITLGNCTKWTIDFDFRIWGGTAADGIAFCFLDAFPTGFVNGGGVGIPGTNGFKVVFDTYDNGCGENPEIQIYNGLGYNECANANQIVKLTNSGGALNFIRSNNYNSARITYDSGNISVLINGTSYLTAYFPISYPGYMGFTSSTGALTDQHSIKNVTVSKLSEMAVAVAERQNPTCVGSNNGKISVSVTGGTPPYTYSWNNSASTTNTANGLLAAVHTVTITDAAGCTTTKTVMLTNPTPMTVTVTNQQNPTCNGKNDGKISVSVTGGTAPYTYSWNNSASTGNTVNDFLAGAHTVTITDAAGCTTTKTVTLTDPALLTATVTSQQNPTCIGGNDGSMSVSVTGGTAPYTYSWNHSASTGNTANDLLADTHTVTITDTLGCMVTQSTILLDPPPTLKVDFITSDSIICLGASMDVTGTASGGKAPYTYAWTSGGTAVGSTQTISANTVTPATEYCITITDACNVSVDSCMTVSLPEPIMPNITPNKKVDCQPAVFTFTNNSTPADQVVSTLFTFGNGRDTLVQGLGDVSSLYTDAQSYTVTVTITSIYGCVYTDTFPNIVEAVAPPLAAFSITPNPTTIYETTVKMFNGSSADCIFWDWSAPDATPISSSSENPVFHFPEGFVGQYPIKLIVTTEVGCKDTVVQILNVNSDIVFYAPNAFTPDGDEHNQRWKIYAMGIDVYNFQVSIFNRWGEIVWESHDPDESWDGTYGGNLVSDGTYTWMASVKGIHNDFKKDYHGSITVLK